jgi:hypothetical protein
MLPCSGRPVLFPVLAVLSRPSSPAVMSKLFCLGGPIQAFLSPIPVHSVMF